MNILSVCDGISCGQVSFEKAGFEINNYYASEICKESMAVTNHNYPKTKQLGNFEGLIKINDDGTVIIGRKLKELPKIDFLIGGTPCQGISKSKSIRENLQDIRSRLFFNYVETLKWLRENNNPNILFLLENVVPNKETEEIMTENIGIKPVMINSNLVSAQNRKRLYWTNINNGAINQPEDKGILIKDIIYDNTYKNFQDGRIKKTRVDTKNYIKWDISEKGYWSQQYRAYYMDGKMCTIPSKTAADKCNIQLSDDLYRRCHPVEAERCQTLPDNYTSIIKSDPKRMALCGDGWTIDVIAHILKQIS